MSPIPPVHRQAPAPPGTPQQPVYHAGSGATPHPPLLDQAAAILDLDNGEPDEDVHFVASPAPRIFPPGMSGPSTSTARHNEPREQRRTAAESAAQTKKLAQQKLIWYDYLFIIDLTAHHFQISLIFCDMF